MSNQKEQPKKEQLKEKVVALVKDFIKIEGGISQNDLRILFGDPLSPYSQIATALGELPIFLQ